MPETLSYQINLNCPIGAAVEQLTELWKGATPFVIADLIRVLIIIAIPAIVIWLPHHAI